MTSCDDILERLFVEGALEAESSDHVRACPRCSRDSSVVDAVRHELTAGRVPETPAVLFARVVTAAQPLLARNRRRVLWRTVGRALATALLPLPVVLLVDAYILGEIYEILSLVLPRMLTLYLISGQATLIALLLAITYGAIPLLVERQQASALRAR